MNMYMIYIYIYIYVSVAVLAQGIRATMRPVARAAPAR